MFDNRCEVEPVEKCESIPAIGSLMLDSVKMLCDLCGILTSIEQMVFGKANGMDNTRENAPESLQDRARMTCETALRCIEKAKHIHEGML